MIKRKRTKQRNLRLCGLDSATLRLLLVELVLVLRSTHENTSVSLKSAKCKVKTKSDFVGLFGFVFISEGLSFFV